MSKPIKQNFLSKQNGCRMIQASAELDKGLAAHIITQDQKELWAFKAKLPQYCIIDTSNLKNYSKVFNRVGFFLWHQYSSNPALIQISYSNNLSDDWTVAGKIRLQLKQQWQYFKIKQIPVTEMKRLKITILENFGDNQTTYLNKVHLGYLKEENSIVENNHREKTFSEFIKLTSTEKQLKKAQEQIKRLVVQNEEIKKTLKRQGDLIFQMQDAFKLVTKQLQKIQKIQELQTQKQIIKQKKNEITALVENKIKGKVNFGTHSSQSETEKEEKQFIQDRMMSKKTVNLLKSKNNSYSYAKSQRNSYKKSRDEDYDEESRYKKGATIRQSRNDLPKKKSQSQLSQYMASQHENCKSHYQQNCKQMLVKLQILMAQRDKRQKQLLEKQR